MIDTQVQLEFTRDWTSQYFPIWERVLGPSLPAKKMFLEIGSFEGQSACWFLQALLDDDGSLWCVDTWEGSPEILADGVDMESVYERFLKNTEICRKPTQRVHHYREESTSALASLVSQRFASRFPVFDLIYVDANHSAQNVLSDAVMSWPLLKSGGLMMFDDYTLGLNAALHLRPKFAIDAFLEIFAEDLSVIIIGPQVIVKKK